MSKAMSVCRDLVNCILTGGILLWCYAANAQVTPDGSLNTTVSQSGNNFAITNGTAAGSNLFHSFGQFSVPYGNVATFNLINTPNISTIFGRVTGGSVSNINGVIQTINNTNPVSLFLLNPSGIIFGPNAQLNLTGSFIGTTANSILFADGSQWSTTNSSTTTVLKNSVPIGLGFGSTGGSIQVQGTGNDGIFPTNSLGIATRPGQTIALVGGDVTFSSGVLTAPSGRIEVGAVGGGTVSLKPSATGWLLGYEQVEELGDINFNARSSLWNPDAIGNPAGGIQVVGRDIRLDQSQIARAVSAKGEGGNIHITAGRSLWLGGLNANAQAPSAWIVNLVTPGTVGNGGAVTVQAPQLTLQDGAAIQTLSLGSGAAGAVQVTADTIKASGNVALSSPFAPTGSSSSRITSENYASGAGGDVGVVARQITLDGGGQISTFVFPGATGHGGNITLDVADTLTANGISPTTLNPSGIGAFSFGIGNGGNIRISTGTLNLIDSGLVNAFTTRLTGVPNTGMGNAGDVTITADKSLSVVGTNPYAPTLSSFLGSVTTGSGNAGNVSITTPNISVQAGAALNSSTVPILGTVFGDRQQLNNGNGGNVTLNVADKIEVMGVNQFTGLASGLGTVTFSNGYAGNTVIKTNQLVVKDGGAIIAVTVATGNAGELDIQANDILVSGENGRRSIIGANAGIFNQTTRQFYGLPDFPTGNTGIVNISTNSLTVSDQGTVSVTHEGQGNAGLLDIQALRLSLINGGRINASTASGFGGNIKLAIQDLLLSRYGSQITTEARGNGNGGNITINGGAITLLEGSKISADAGLGQGGNISINTPGLFQSADSNITATSGIGINGVINISTPGVNQENVLVPQSNSFISTEQVVASSCLGNRNVTQGRFVVTGNGGLAETPNGNLELPYSVVQVRSTTPITTEQKPQNHTSASAPSWKIGDAVIEATQLVATANGRLLLIATPTEANTQSLICPTSN